MKINEESCAQYVFFAFLEDFKYSLLSHQFSITPLKKIIKQVLMQRRLS